MDKFLDLKLRKEVLDALSPYEDTIKSLKIDYIGYREFYKDGSSMAFCSNKNWYKVVQDDEMTRDMSIHYAQELMSVKNNEYNYIIRTAACANNRFLKELLARDLCNSLLIYQHENNVIKMYSFIVHSSNITALNYFINKRQLFEAAINSYKYVFERIFQKEEYQVLRMPLFCSKLVSDIFNKDMIIDDKDEKYFLTSKELEYIPLLLKGASNKDIAAQFKCTIRTVQFHVNNIKKKFKVVSRYKIQFSIQVSSNKQSAV